ncbi:lytic murein transglycosylase [Halopseudomonas salegens]|uniref:Membrane-bound lytic murein transglycosylase B n=1 Tax=Halopseudomonas salegens TaxID=1434072 RepID=A0A1H2GEP6_9GAMM|nr:lytic murein transglycosylase [Halopseudomonas salegens]SDU18206.1 membrane-bound lytic murein transglycosylase B [Halopseudomonas salegens]
MRLLPAHAPFTMPSRLPTTLLLGCALALTACASSALTAELNHSPEASSAVEQTVDFEQWLAGFRQRALTQGVDQDIIQQATRELSPDPAVIRADQHQPEFSRPVWEYLEGALSTIRINNGQLLLQEHADLLTAIEQRYGVDRHILVAIWGLESNFGGNMGNRKVVRSLATLAHQGRRPEFAETQLLAALTILQRGDISVDAMVGSWAGAMGQTQFIPTTYNSHAVDFDGNGKRDIWSSKADALASAANYLQASNWQSGQPWGFETRLPEDFDYAKADLNQRRSLAEWREAGLYLPERYNSLEADSTAAILLPAGHRGPAFLVFDNFHSILRYNSSTSYALAIGLLSERLQGRGEIQASWPTQDQPLSREQRHELQQILTDYGFEPGEVDGILGANTRAAIRRFQQEHQLPADGYANLKLLQLLRKL